MLYIGLTGNIASGKSEVATHLASRGATIIDADVLARAVVDPGTPALAQIVTRWGPQVLADDGTLNRATLRQIVFNSPEDLDALNAIVHPAIETLREQLLTEARTRGDHIVIYAVPLLFENHLANQFDKIILVDAPPDLRLDRLTQHRALPLEEATQMIAAQMPSTLKRPHADFIIENTSTLPELKAQADTIWERLTA